MLTEKQLKARQKGLGGSDAAAAVGLSPYKTPLELYLEKRGEIEPPDLSGNPKVHWGEILEEVIAQEYTRQTGRRVRRVNQTLYHPDYPWMLCHLDRSVVGGNGYALECKATSIKDGWGEEGTDQVPEPIVVQCQHNLAVAGKQVMDVPVLINGSDWRLYSVPRDDEFIRLLVEREELFVELIKNGTPPEPDFGHQTTPALLGRMYPGTNGETIELPEGAYHWHEMLLEAKEQIKGHKAVADGAKAHLQHLMGEAAIGRLSDGSSYNRKLVNRKSYEVKATSYIDFRHKKGGK